MSDIKSMQLYNHVERINNELAELGIDENAALTVDVLSALDQLHYHGTEALDSALQMTSAVAGQRWLEIGSGLGGPARYLADKGGIAMTALELQPDQHALALHLSERCGLADRIDHRCGDFLEAEFADESFDAVVSWLALYHIPERPRLLKKCHALLRPGGYFYTEDLCSLGEIGAEQRGDLSSELYATCLPKKQTYREQLEKAGFVIESFEDVSEDWAAFTRQRLKQYRADRERHVRVHGESTVEALDQFYCAVDFHFHSRKLGGLRICARKP